MRTALRPVALAAAVVLIGAGVVVAQSAGTISVRVRVVQAGEQQGKIDKGCEDVPKIIKPMRFGSLRLIRDQQLLLRFGQQGVVLLPTGEKVQLKPVSIHGKRLYMHVQAPKINGSLKMRHGKHVVVGGQAFQGGRLIVLIVPEFPEF
jgi:hypothetical protein